LFGLGQHVLRGLVTEPVGQADALFGQQSSNRESPQYSLRLSQHFLPHGSCRVPHWAQSPTFGFLQRQPGLQQLIPQRDRPREHLGRHVDVLGPPPGTWIRTHSVRGGQQTLLQTTWSGGHGTMQTPLKQISLSPQHCLFALGPQKLRPSGHVHCS